MASMISLSYNRTNIELKLLQNYVLFQHQVVIIVLI